VEVAVSFLFLGFGVEVRTTTILYPYCSATLRVLIGPAAHSTVTVVVKWSVRTNTPVT
jgi:hypothetical protein